MQIYLGIIGLFIVLITFIDLVMSTLTAAHDGPISFLVVDTVRIIGIKLSRLFLKKRRARHAVLSLIGVSTITSLFTFWLIGFWIGWTLIFLSNRADIQNSTSGDPASVANVFYFAGYVLSTQGLGDYQPVSVAYQIFVTLEGFNGFIFMTIAVTHLISIVQSFVKLRQTASAMYTIGGNPTDILINAWNGQDFGSLKDFMMSYAQEVSAMSQLERSHPIIFGYHTHHKRASISIALVSFSELVVLMRCAIPTNFQIENFVLLSCERSLKGYFTDVIKIHHFAHTGTYKDKNNNIEGAPPVPSLKELAEHNIPLVSEDQFHLNINNPQIVELRNLSSSLLDNVGWYWEDIQKEET